MRRRGVFAIISKTLRGILVNIQNLKMKKKMERRAVISVISKTLRWILVNT